MPLDVAAQQLYGYIGTTHEQNSEAYSVHGIHIQNSEAYSGYGISFDIKNKKNKLN